MSPDIFLSQNGIRTEEYGGFNGTPAQKVALLQAINKTRTWNDQLGTFEDITYHTPNFVATDSTFDSSLIGIENRLVQSYYAALRTGDLDIVHAAVDTINNQRMAVGPPQEFVPMSDFAIIAHALTPLGSMCRFIVSERKSVDESGFGTFAGSPLPWFDTKGAYDALNSYIIP